MAIGVNTGWQSDHDSGAEKSKNRLKIIQKVVMFLGSFGFLLIMASLSTVQGPAKKRFPGCDNFVLAVAYHFFLALPDKFSQPGNHSFAGPCIG